ncbi:nitrite reductase small subunit NirD [Leptospira meyeri]|uniref:nitrite reductase small subunit NirD n=1 Tax=Leptospira meyeri TaxID=29508 RepID=UPI000C2ACB4A|nr:nitrite reductase small subunit NirD [Leptospira meyeri]PKA26364.1 nitrite reductase (NAD(P)H) small subunit [Leptospira sp. mixed culture ATI2-C-A1]MCW7487728.1 nitrite reductase small subunit NirD [Leptospira meyeri]PJZ79921.1 nitrite reductase (NAD(P)H) small subunit [Leptospira meyeri]PJZ96121.1 nitrite reductase (NAD(P)H) small subunit [Leptospira meyeri]PKA14013.1 nitrite reductase (NAD(P)H) small subunit [Leptospira meyeri]
MGTSIKNKERVLIGPVSDFEKEGGVSAKVGEKQIAIFYFESRNEWYACDNACPHTGDMVLSRGFLGDNNGEPKIVCPLHKRNFSLTNGDCLSGENYKVNVYPVIVENGSVYLEMDSSSYSNS